LTLRAELPEPPGDRTTNVWLNCVLGPEGDTDTERVTVPLNPMLVRVRFKLLDELWGRVIDPELAKIVKSTVAKVNVAELE
jgi:hypothetical protein